MSFLDRTASLAVKVRDLFRPTPKPVPIQQKSEEKPYTGTVIPTDTQTSSSYRSAGGEVQRVYRSWTPSFSSCDQMLQADAVCAFGYNMLTLPILRSSPQLIADDDPRAQEQLDFLSKTFVDTGILADTLEKLRWGPGYGFAALELRWQIDKVENCVIARSPRLLKWGNCYILEEEKAGPDLGSFKGIRYQNEGGPKSEVKLFAADNKCALLTWNEALSGGNRYGVSQLTGAYEPWRVRRFATLQDMARYVEMHANPPVIGTYPEGKSRDQNGREVDNGTQMFDILHKLRQGGKAALPYKGSGSDGTGENIWNIESLNVADRTALYESCNRILSREILQALLIPERAVTEGMYGTKAEAEVHGEILGMVQTWILAEICDVINQSIINPLLMWNFGSEAHPSVKLSYNVISKHSASLQALVVSKIADTWAAGNPVDPVIKDKVYEITGFELPDPIPPQKPIGLKESPGVVETGEDVDSFSHFEDRFIDPREMLAKMEDGKFKPWRKLTDIELMIGTENQWIQFLSRQLKDEGGLIDKLEVLVEDMGKGSEAFVRKLWTDTQDAPTRRIQGVNKFIPRYTTDVKKIITRWLMEQTEAAAYNQFEKEGALKQWPGALSGPIRAWVYGEADRISTGLIQSLTNAVKAILKESASQNDDVNAAVRKAKEIFRNAVTPGRTGSVGWFISGIANTAIAKGQEMILERKGRTGAYIYNGEKELEGDNEIVVIVRSAYLDQFTCEVCKKLDGIRIRADYEQAQKWVAPHLCKGNWPSTGYRCRCRNIYLKAKTRPEILEDIDIPDRTINPLPASMQTGAFGKEVLCQRK